MEEEFYEINLFCKDYAVLKLSKSIGKIFIPAFETRSPVKITAFGDDK
ncbi:MAG: hypothetical protein WA584_03960 [Pyrinomonadaceae bacterium]